MICHIVTNGGEYIIERGIMICHIVTNGGEYIIEGGIMICHIVTNGGEYIIEGGIMICHIVTNPNCFWKWLFTLSNAVELEPIQIFLCIILGIIELFKYHCKFLKLYVSDDFYRVYRCHNELAKYFQSTDDKWLSDHFFENCLNYSMKVEGGGGRVAAHGHCDVGLSLEKTGEYVLSISWGGSRGIEKWIDQEVEE